MLNKSVILLYINSVYDFKNWLLCANSSPKCFSENTVHQGIVKYDSTPDFVKILYFPAYKTHFLTPKG